ncbi:MAG: SRPBCC family protein [Actinobacteria bacterium]|nr:SRPBCC family protein [Actinomycetota bacterium]
MSGVTVSVHLTAPPAEVWDDVARLDRHVEWMADARTIEFTGDRSEGEGTTMAVETRIGPFRTTDLMEVTSWEPPRRIAVEHRGLFTGRGAFTLEPEGGGTRFTWSEHIAFPWFLGGPAGAWAARPVLRWVWRRNLRRLAARFTSR